MLHKVTDVVLEPRFKIILYPNHYAVLPSIDVSQSHIFSSVSLLGDSLDCPVAS